MTSSIAFHVPEELAERVVDLLADRVVAKATERLRLEAESYIGSKAAAEFLDCSMQRIHGLVHQQRLPHRKDGSRLLFKRSELDAYLEENGG